jgi:transposase-like protein
MSRKTRYSTEFKQDAVSRMGQGGKTVTALAEVLIPVARAVAGWRQVGTRARPGKAADSLSLNPAAVQFLR